MIRIAEKYYQYNQEFISLTLNYKTISKNSEVLIYGDSPYGYQRQVNKLHLNRMVSTLKSTKELLSPTSILLGVSPQQINSTLKELEIDSDKINSKEGIFMLDTNKIDFKFRIIDGQHRIKAFEKVFDEITDEETRLELEKYMFNVIIAVIPENDRVQEVELFRTINSKAKPLKTDLAMLAKYNYEVMYKKEDVDYKNHIKTRIIFYLNDESLKKSRENCWINGIKVDVNNIKAPGSVGFKSFGDSIDKIVDKYMKVNNIEKIKSLQLEEVSAIRYDKIDEILEKSSIELLDNLIIPAWEIIHRKWYQAFEEEYIYYGDEKLRKYYDSDFYIQQTMGVKALNGLLSSYYEKFGNFEETLNEFNKDINQSRLTEKDWIKGGQMKGLSSEYGFKIIREMIVI